MNSSINFTGSFYLKNIYMIDDKNNRLRSHAVVDSWRVSFGFVRCLGYHKSAVGTKLDKPKK